MKIPEVERYFQRLSQERVLLEDLTAQLTVGESYFFREPAQFQWIREKILPDLLGLRGKGCRLRAWSAGCSAGEEAYSLAILFEEEGLRNHAPIKATDISLPSLLKAKRAVYSPWSLRGREEGWMKQYLKPCPEGYQLAPRFVSRVEFEALNLAVDSYPDLATSFWGMDLILCRNVLIYFSPKIVQKVFQKLIATLSEGGWLITGPSDPLFEDNSHCEMIVSSAGVLYRKNSKVKSHSVLFSLEAPFLPGPSKDFAAPAEPFPKETPSASQTVVPAGMTPTAYAAEAASKAKSAFESKDYEQVLQWTEPHLQEATACLLHLKALANLRGTDAAARAAEAAVKAHPLSPEIYFLRAVLSMNSGRDRDAARDFRKTLYLDPTLAVAHFALGSVLRRLQDVKNAGKYFENTLRLCRELPPQAPLRLSDGGSADQLREAAQTQLSLMGA